MTTDEPFRPSNATPRAGVPADPRRARLRRRPDLDATVLPGRSAGVGGSGWSNALQTRYLNGDAADEVIARESSSAVVPWYMTDRLGSVRDLLDGSGSLKDQITYDGFGNATNVTSPANGDESRTGEWSVNMSAVPAV